MGVGVGVKVEYCVPSDAHPGVTSSLEVGGRRGWREGRGVDSRGWKVGGGRWGERVGAKGGIRTMVTWYDVY